MSNYFLKKLKSKVQSVIFERRQNHENSLQTFDKYTGCDLLFNNKNSFVPRLYINQSIKNEDINKRMQGFDALLKDSMKINRHIMRNYNRSFSKGLDKFNQSIPKKKHDIRRRLYKSINLISTYNEKKRVQLLKPIIFKLSPTNILFDKITKRAMFVHKIAKIKRILNQSLNLSNENSKGMNFNIPKPLSKDRTSTHHNINYKFKRKEQINFSIDQIAQTIFPY